MAVDRNKVMKQTEQAAARSGKFRYLKKDTTTVLRVLEYTDKDGDQVFAQQQVEHRRDGRDGKGLGICRREMFDLPCAFCRVNEMAREKGKDEPFISRTRYIINAVNINEDPLRVKMWVVPTTIFNGLAEYVLDEEWGDILEPKKGNPFSITKEGSGLETSYSIKPKRNSYPVGKELLKQVVNPLDEVRDPGLEIQCSEIGVKMSAIFDDSELEEMSKSEKRTGKKTTIKIKHDADPEPEFDIGVAVRYQDEKAVCHIKTIDGDDVTIEDEASDTFDVTIGDLTLVEIEMKDEKQDFSVGTRVLYKDEKSECVIDAINGDDVTIKDAAGDMYNVALGDLTWAGPADTNANVSADIAAANVEDEDTPRCLGDSALYDASDDECKKCPHFKSCGKKAGSSPADKSEKKTGKSSSKKETGKSKVDDDVIAGIIG